MATIPLPSDFREFLSLLNDHGVEYLLIGGYAVGYHGYVRSTGDIDVWISTDTENAQRTVEALTAFGFGVAGLSAERLTRDDQIIRMGHPPMQIEIQTSISGVNFDNCYAAREEVEWDGIRIPIINLEDLKQNKRASGRLKDLADLANL